MSHVSSSGDPGDGGTDAPNPSPPPMSESDAGPAASRRESGGGRFRPGQILFDRYQIVQPLGHGGMGEVWLARHLKLACDRAIKLIHPEYSRDQRFRARFEIEAETMARIKHPQAVVVHNADTIEGVCYIEMEYIPGRPLSEEIAGGSVMPPDRVVLLFNQLADVLDEIHKEGIVHRDLKPSNLMLVDGEPPERNLKVLDFGIAKRMEAGEELTRTGEIIGTSGYASPEQLAGREIDRRTDIYSMGLLLCLLLTGRLPRRGPSHSFHLANRPWDAADGGGNLPEPVRDLIAECLDNDPGQRPRSAGEVAARLADGFSFATPSAEAANRRLSSGASAPARPVNRRVALAAAAAALGLGAVLWRRPGAPPREHSPNDEANAATPERKTTDAGPPALAPPRLGARGVLAEILDDVRALSEDQRANARYVSWNHRLAAGVPADRIAAMRTELEAAFAGIARKPMKLAAAGSGRSAVYRFDLRDLGWDARPYVIEPTSASGVRPPTLHDLILLEYPFGWVEEGLAERSALESEYLNDLRQVRPVAHLHGDWLADAITRPPLAGDLGIGSSPPPASPPTPLAERDAAAALGFADLADYRAALDRLDPGERPAEFDALRRGGALAPEVWRRRFPEFIRRVGRGRPLPPVDDAELVGRDAAVGPTTLEIRPDRTELVVGGPGPTVQLANRTDQPLFVEWVARSGAGVVALPRETEHRGVIELRSGSVATLEFDGPVQGPAGRDHLVFYSSTARFPAGTLLQAPGRADRFVHLGDFPVERIARTVIAIETVAP